MELLFIFLIGISIGSFANVLIYRLPKEVSVVSPASACPHCGSKISFYQNIPIFSYLLLRGKSGCCNKPIGFIYPLIELIGGLLFVAVYMKLDLGVDLFIIGTAFILLLALSIIDYKHLVAYDSLNLATLTLALFAYGNFFDNLQNALLIGGGFAFLRFYLSFLLGKEAMGEGDIIIGGTIGALVGVQLGLVSLFVASVYALPVALIVKYITKKEPEIPFIPFLSLGLFTVFIFDRFFFQFVSHI
ncbi:MAG: prepilin peptidase [Campylobacterales bacterium]|nr:prepilin peptidase [Campylobacterales bacterium]